MKDYINEVALPYLLLLGISIFIWFVGHELSRSKTFNPNSIMIKIIRAVVGYPVHDYLIRFLGSVLILVVIISFVLGLPRERLRDYWSIVFFYGFVAVSGPLIVIVGIIGLIKKFSGK